MRKQTLNPRFFEPLTSGGVVFQPVLSVILWVFTVCLGLCLQALANLPQWWETCSVGLITLMTKLKTLPLLWCNNNLLDDFQMDLGQLQNCQATKKCLQYYGINSYMFYVFLVVTVYEIEKLLHI